ncbi:hypothetical protein Peur_000081 [Populus x canadensis]
MGDVLGKIKGDPDIERDRGIQTREDQLGYCEKRNDLLKYTRSAEEGIKYHNKKHEGAKFKLVEIISACSFFSMGVWEHINFTASEDDKSLKLFFAELSHGEAHWGTNHNTEAEKITACCLLEEGELCISFVPSYSHSGVCLSISMHELYFIITCIVFYIIVSGLFIIIIGSTKDYCGFCPHEDKVYHPLQGFTAGIRW